MRSSRSTSGRYPRGITKRPEGWRISVRVKGRLIQRSFKPSTDQADVEAELLKARHQWRAGREAVASGSLGDDIAQYVVNHFTGRPGSAEWTRYLQLWATALGSHRPRSAVTKDEIARVLNGWRAEGYAADTCNKRRTALLAFYHAMDGKGGRNPVREVRKFRPPDPLPRGLAYSQIAKALATMSACKTKARLAVLAYTGMRAGQLMKLTPDHWDHRQHVLTVPGTTKGRGTKPYVVPLSSLATAALKAFDAIDAWGTFRVSPMGRMWKTAAAKAKLPAGTVPYDLRHSFGTAIYQATGDLHAARKLLGHASIQMTERYTLAAVPAQQLAAVRAFDKLTRRKLPAKVASLRKHSRKQANR